MSDQSTFTMVRCINYGSNTVNILSDYVYVRINYTYQKKILFSIFFYFITLQIKRNFFSGSGEGIKL